jgi:FdhE protein
MTERDGARLERLARERPEWRPWTAMLTHALHEAGNLGWEAWVPAAPDDHDGTAPLLAGAVIRIDRAIAQRWIDTLFSAAVQGDSPAAASLTARSGLDGLSILEAAVCQNHAALSELAAAVGAARAPFRSVAELAALPLLQACGRRWARSVAPSWRQGYCPVCGAWPALAEARGVKRRRRLRCARCGGDWETDWLRCPFCDMRDHARLSSLMEEAAADRRKVEICLACRSYLKTLTTPQGSPGAEVLVDDLATVDLDVAALAEGYLRPVGPGYSLEARVVEKTGLARRLFAGRP